ncbi:hypothetical protein GPECTOR_142g704 [Gonium pectorale]|uniref:Uncharacterized protein n=1 Tax=Gonium pectorale TaxID=33097 RepID=A0A150FXY7_GONPE|nr:hypothetical protein GPECTOR_142g704 [Gonium pectorale]|eukprot:KXZ42483.1 hypothetical protein GPECTOR_142g704 [Gonium pectorale]
MSHRSTAPVGFFQPIAGRPAANSELKVDRHTDLIHKVFKMSCDPHKMYGVQETEAARLIASGKTAELLDRIYASYASYKEGHDLVLMEGPGSGLGDTELDAHVSGRRRPTVGR